MFANSDKKSKKKDSDEDILDLLTPKLDNNLNPGNEKVLKTNNIDENEDKLHVNSPRSNDNKHDSNPSVPDDGEKQTDPGNKNAKDNADTGATHSSTNSPDHKEDTRVQIHQKSKTLATSPANYENFNNFAAFSFLF